MDRAFFDTSVLVAGLIEDSAVPSAPAESPAATLLDRVIEGALPRPLTAWHCCLELYSVLTRMPPRWRVPPESVLLLLERNVFPHFDVAQLAPEHHGPFLRSAAAEAVQGGRLYDAHIAEIARTSRAQVVVTENRRDFAGLLRHGIAVLSSAELLHRLDGAAP